LFLPLLLNPLGQLLLSTVVVGTPSSANAGHPLPEIADDVILVQPDSTIATISCENCCDHPIKLEQQISVEYNDSDKLDSSHSLHE
jgi:hypothetical protein